MKLAQVLPHLLYQFSSETELIRAVDELSMAFTKERQQITKYLTDRRLVSAYTAFYLTTNLPKFAAILAWLTPEERFALRQYQLLDVGAGPGTFSLAWRQLVGGETVMLETSELMREQASRLMEGLGEARANFTVALSEKPRLMLFGHSLNEMGRVAALSYIEQHAPAKVWFIEPGTKQVFREMLELRTEMIQRGWQIRYPCLGQGECPMSQTEDWCHQYIHVQHEVDVERLTQLAEKDRRRLPLTVFMFEQSPPLQPQGQARVVRVFPATKFSHEWAVCYPAPLGLHLERFQLPFKSYPKEWYKSVAAISAGSLLRYAVDKELPNGVRIRLVKEESSN